MITANHAHILGKAIAQLLGHSRRQSRFCVVFRPAVDTPLAMRTLLFLGILFLALSTRPMKIAILLPIKRFLRRTIPFCARRFLRATRRYFCGYKLSNVKL